MLVRLLVLSFFTATSMFAQDYVPEWAKHAVWYQIFPERFRNGDATNDPTPDDMVGSWPHERADGWKLSAWTGDWYARPEWERKGGREFYRDVQLRRYGGDLQGVLDKLDYLQSLGVTALYFNPLFESPSLHKYDATMYHHIDNNFGPDPVGDARVWTSEIPWKPETWKWTSADSLFLALVRKCHDRGIRVIIDGVFNHVGMTFWALNDVRARGKSSAFSDWFTINRYDDPATPKDEFSYAGWFGIAELPELREDQHGLIQPIQDHINAVVRRWMDPNGDGDPSDGIDGWRLDVAEKVHPEYWRTFRQLVRGVNPQAYLVGEVWWDDWANERMFNAAPWLQGDQFDAVMNYRWAREAVRFFAAHRAKISASEFARRAELLLKEYPPQVNAVLLNLFDSHDTDRLASRVVNSDLPYDKGVSLSDNRSYEIRKPTEEELRTVKLMAVYQMTFLGAPCLYAGEEAGMWGGDDPDCRKPMLWDDLTYENEKGHPFGGVRPDDVNKFRPDLFNHYAGLIRYRKEHGALRTGDVRFVLKDDSNDVLAYTRGTKDEIILVVLNNSWEVRKVVIDLPPNTSRSQWFPGIGGGTHRAEGNQMIIDVAAKSGRTFHAELP